MHSYANKAGKSNAFKLNPIAAACAAALLMASTASFAQQADTATTEEAEAKKKAGDAQELDAIQVTGVRRSIENSIERKKENTSIVEVISAEDIGKLPDNSIADAISRAPGLTAQRVAGRASTISIRGFAGDFSTTLLNGREQVSVGDNRGVEYDQYPSELIGGVTIYKTPDAKLIGQGLSGTVDLQTLKPLSYKERTISLNARIEQNSLGEVNPGYSDRGNRFSATYIDQFADNTFGVAIGVARLDSPGQNNAWEATGYRTNEASRRPTPGNPNPLFNPNDPLFDVYYYEGSKQRASSTDNVRTGVMAVFEYKPNDTFHSELDVFFSKFDKAEVVRGMEMGLGWTGAEPTNATIATRSDGVRFVSGGSFANIRPVLKDELITSNDKLFSIGWNNKLKLNDDWTAVLDVSGSTAERDDRFLELYTGATNAAGNAALPGSVGFTIDPSTNVPTYNFGINYADPAIVRLTDTSGWGQAGFVKTPQIRDDQVALRLNFKRDFLEGAFSSVEFGLNYSDRDKSRASVENFIDLRSGRDSSTAIPPQFLQGPVTLDLTGGSRIAYDLDSVFNSGVYTLRALRNGDVLNKNWSVNEKVATFFGQLNIDTALGSVPVRGNFGVQYAKTDQSSDGFAVTSIAGAQAAIPYTSGAKFGDVLPSLNLSFELPYNQVIRFGGAKTLARARLDEMRASNGYSCNFEARPTELNLPPGQSLPATSCYWRANGGNPQLEPTRANSYDLAYEKYFDTPGAFLGLAYFYKDLTTYTYRQSVQVDFAGFANPGTLIPANNGVGTFDRPVNGNGGFVKGFELNVSIPFAMFSEALDGFGFTFNASDISSDIQREGPGTNSAFPGLSEQSANATLYFEKYGFSARVSHRYRDDFLGEVTGFGADRDFKTIKAEGITDLQLGYNFAEGTRFEGLSILLQANNLTNEAYRQTRTFGSGFEAPTLYGEYGRSILLGLNYKF
jgi:iron complex outermembrane recepter protein